MGKGKSLSLPKLDVSLVDQILARKGWNKYTIFSLSFYLTTSRHQREIQDQENELVGKSRVSKTTWVWIQRNHIKASYISTHLGPQHSYRSSWASRVDTLCSSKSKRPYFK